MVISIGVDIEDIHRFSSQLDNINFLRKIFTSGELEYCFSKTLPAQHFTARFAAKEAVSKALGSLGIVSSKEISFRDIEILNDENGAPKVYISKLDLSKKY